VNKILEILQGGVSLDASKDEIKSVISQLSEGLGKAHEFLQNTDHEKFFDAIVKNAPAVFGKAYDEGKISEQTVEEARKMALIYQNPVVDKMYEFHKKMYEFCKNIKEKGLA
jgi:hypothetical protein